MYAKKHERGKELVLAVCDKELLGKTLREGFVVSERFYKGELVEPEELKLLFEEATIINLVGERCVYHAKESGLVNENIMLIEGVPHAQSVRMIKNGEF